MPNANAAAPKTADQEEIARFNRLAETWWDPSGPMRPLHAMNPVRLAYILEHCSRHFDLPAGTSGTSSTRLSGLSVVDVGCGGGLLTEPFYRLGATVTGLDAAEDAIAVARHHAEACGLTAHKHLTYRTAMPEDLMAEGARFDIVLALEIVEHVRDVDAFLHTLSALLKPGGAVFLSTINRTPQAWASALFVAERVLKLLPAGTHDYDKLVKPAELVRGLRRHNIRAKDVSGLGYDPVTREWKRQQSRSVNYILYATAPLADPA